ncbi:FliH/SctL family protein [Aquabacterium sp.]|uniref:FliH/SctL family protein n=1 Tax=Aquabacterium sp. TaxID=1872578 RepID=UPI0040376F95
MSTSKQGNPPPGGSPPNSASGASNTTAPNSYTRFIPREELGAFSAWAPETFEQPPKGANGEEGGVRKPTLAERAAAEMRPPNMKANGAKHAPQATGGTATPSAGAAKPAPAKPAPVKPAPVKRPIVGGVPGEMPPEPPPEAPPAPPAPDVEELVREARQTGYQDGYRNGLAALESYKQTQAAQMAAYMSDQVGVLASDFHQRLESLEQQLAGRIAGVALELARQVVRSELKQNPEVVVDVAEQALTTLLASARQIVLRLNPDDHGMAQAQLSELLAVRGARMVPDASITRGGCVVESDIAVVDASVEARWDRAAAAMGHNAPWNDGKEALGSTEVRLPEGEDELDDWPESEANGLAAPRGEGEV